MGQNWVSDAFLSFDGGFKEGRVEARSSAKPVCLFSMKSRVDIGKPGKRGRRELLLGKHPDTKSRITW